MINFEKLAFSQQVLRALAHGMEKRADPIVTGLGLLGKGALGVGKAALRHPQGAMMLGVTGLGAASSVGNGVQQARQWNAGFHPSVQQYINTPIR